VNGSIEKNRTEKRRLLPWQRRRRRLLRGFAFLFLLLALPLISAKAYIAWRLEASHDEIRALGLPATVEELAAAYPPPQAGQNVAVRLTRIMGAHDETPGVDLRNLDEQIAREKILEPFSEPLKAMIRQHLDWNTELLAQVHAASALPGARYSLEFRQDVRADPPDFAPPILAVRLLHLESLLAAEDGDLEKAREAIIAGYSLSEILREEPSSAAQMARIACHSRMGHGLRHVLSVADFTGDQLIPMQDAVARLELPGALTRAWAYERAVALMAYEQPDRGNLPVRATPLDEIVHPGTTIFVYNVAQRLAWNEWDRIWLASIMTQAIVASQSPTAELSLRMRAIDAQTRPYRVSAFPRRSSTLLPNMEQTANPYLRDMSETRCATAALAIERFRVECHQLPATLDELLPDFLTAVPVDPFDGAPLRYRTTDYGYAVYSVAERPGNPGDLRAIKAKRTLAGTKSGDAGPKTDAAPDWYREGYVVFSRRCAP
jgi:hypothetical protein